MFDKLMFFIFIRLYVRQVNRERRAKGLPPKAAHFILREHLRDMASSGNPEKVIHARLMQRAASHLPGSAEREGILAELDKRAAQHPEPFSWIKMFRALRTSEPKP
jgi:hypothetical protein